MTEYNILAKVIIDTSTVDAKLKSYNPSIKVKVDGGTSANELGKLNTTIGTLQNKLERLKISNADAFRSQPILDQYTRMQDLVGAYSRGETSLGNVNIEMGKFENNIKRSNEGIRTTTTSVDGLGTALRKAVEKIALWAVATTAIYGSLKQFQEGVQYIKDLNKSMTDTQIVTGYTKSEIASLATQYNDLAIEIGATTLEVAEGALEWQRQGKTIDETTQLLRASVMMAKLANMDQAASTEALTSIINGYKLSIDEVMPTIDRLIALDNNFATSTQEIADALTKVSAVSKQSNVSLEEMAAMITVVSSDTRIAAESIGQSFKTILMRMQNVKLGKYLSDEGEDISDVEKVLTSLGIKLRDDKNTWRDFSDVLAEVRIKWKELGDEGKTVEQSMLVNAFAGQRQANVLTDLLNNQDKYNQALGVEAEALGTTEARYAIYSDNIEAASKRLTATWEKMWSTFISDDFIKYIINAGAGTLEFFNKLGGLNTALEITIALLIAFNRELIITGTSQIATFIGSLIAKYFGLSQSIASATGATTAFNAANASAAATSGAVALAIFAVIKAFQTYDQEVTQRQKAGAEQIASQWQRIISTSKTTEEAVNRITKAFEIQNRLLGAGQERKININSLNQAIPALANLTSSYDEYYNAIQRVAEASGYMVDEQGKFYTVTQYMGKEIRNYVDDINNMSEAEWSAAKMAQIAASGYEDAWVSAWENTHPNVEKKIEDFDALAEASKTSSEAIESSLSSLQSIEESYQKNGELSLAQASELINMGYAETLMIDTKTGKITVNAQALHYLVIASAEAAAADAQLAYAASAAIPAHEAETAALYKKWQVLVGIAGKLKALPETSFSIPSISSGSSGSSGTSAQEKLNNLKKEAYQQEIKSVNAQKKAAQAEIDALEDKKDAYNDIIDAQKESLRLTKEEDDYQKELEDKNKELADIDAELIQLQFDNSEEGNARRLELEEQRAEKTADIAEYQADRTYDIEIEALDREAEAYEKMIDMQIAGVQTIIDGYDSVIAKINEMIDALSKVSSAASGTGVSTAVAKTTTAKKASTTTTIKTTDTTIRGQEINANKDLNGNGIIGFNSGGSFETNSEGLIRVHPNEIGAILNKSQISAAAPMASFMSSIMKNSSTPQISSNNVGGGGVSIGDIQISVAGNLDKTVLPDLKEMIMKTITDATRNTGTLRNAKSFSV
jgi:TP901 family phage tail tape measure protein